MLYVKIQQKYLCMTFCFYTTPAFCYCCCNGIKVYIRLLVTTYFAQTVVWVLQIIVAFPTRKRTSTLKINWNWRCGWHHNKQLYYFISSAPPCFINKREPGEIHDQVGPGLQEITKDKKTQVIWLRTCTSLGDRRRKRRRRKRRSRMLFYKYKPHISLA